MASESASTAVVKLVTGTMALTSEKRTLRLPSSVLKLPSNLTSARIIKLPPGVVLLKPGMTSVLSKSTGATLNKPQILKLSCVKRQENPNVANKKPIILYSSVKQGNSVNSIEKETRSVDKIESQVSKEPSASQVSKEPSASQVSKEPSATQVSKEPSASQVSKEPSATQVSKEPSTTQVSKEPSPSQVSKEPSASQVSKEPSAAVETGSNQNSSRNPWWRDHHHLWKSKEPIVLFSGCKPEDLEPKKKKEPPASLPCPKKLKDILPEGWNYHIADYEELKASENFKAQVRVNISKKEDALRWLQDFEVSSGTNFRIAKTFKENSNRIIFKKCYRCHKNTLRKDRPLRRETKRSPPCQARLIITVKNTDMKTSADLLLNNYPCVVGIYHNHNHLLATVETLRRRRPLPEIREKLANMFRAKITPAAALRLHMSDLKRNHGDKYTEVIQDGARCPTLPWCYRLYYETLGKKVKDGKKRSLRRSSYKKKTAAVPRDEASPVVHYNTLDGVSTSFTVTVNDKHETEEMQRSINSLYEYGFLSKSNVGEDGQFVENVEIVNTSENDVILDNNSEAICQSFEGENSAELSKEDEILDAHDNDDEAVADDYIDNCEVVGNEECAEEFEDACQILNSGASPVAAEEMMEEVLCHSTSSAGCARMDVERAKQDLHRVFNDINSKLISEPDKYLSAVNQFTSQYDKLETESNSDPIMALGEFGCNISHNSNLVSTNGFSSLVEKIIEKKESLSVCSKSQSSGSPKRKVLVLRMDPNKFNQILGRVGKKNPKLDMVNI